MPFRIRRGSCVNFFPGIRRRGRIHCSKIALLAKDISIALDRYRTKLFNMFLTIQFCTCDLCTAADGFICMVDIEKNEFLISINLFFVSFQLGVHTHKYPQLRIQASVFLELRICLVKFPFGKEQLLKAFLLSVGKLNILRPYLLFLCYGLLNRPNQFSSCN